MGYPLGLKVRAITSPQGWASAGRPGCGWRAVTSGRGVGAGGEQRRAHLVEAGAGLQEPARLQRQAGERAEVDHRGGMRERLGADRGGVRRRVGRRRAGRRLGGAGSTSSSAAAASSAASSAAASAGSARVILGSVAGRGLDRLDQRRRRVAEPADVEPRRDAHRLGEPVGEAELHRLRGVEPGLLRHQRGDVVLGAARLRHVAGDEAALDLVERLGHRPHVVGGAHHEPRGVVDHQEGVLRHHHLVAGHGDVGGGRGGDAVDPDGDRAGVALQRVVDRHRVEDRAAGAVQPQRQRAVVGQRAELVEEALRRDAVGADLVIDRDLRALGAGADRIPGSHGVQSSSVSGSRSGVARAPWVSPGFVR